MAVVDKNKLLGTTGKGGDLMVRPTTSLVGSSGGKITETSDEKDVVHTISVKLVKVDKFLKGSLVADKAAQKKEQKQKEDQLRAEQEQDTEKPDAGEEDEETPKPLMPKMSFLDKIKDFLGKVIIGWFTFRLLKFLPRVMGIVRVIGKIADFVIWFGGKLLDGLITMVHWGYKAFEWTRGVVGNIFGDKGVEVFDKISGVLNTVLNLTMMLAAAMIALSNEFGTNLLDFGKNFTRLFKHGIGPRVLKRALIQVFGKKGASTLIGWGTKALGIAKAAPLAAVAKGALIVTAASGAAYAIGEGGSRLMKLNDRITNYARDAHEKSKDLKWWDPRKYFWGVVAGVSDVAHRLTGAMTGFFDILGTPFRLLSNWARVQFAPEDQKEAVRENIAKEMTAFDGRVREQMRRFYNMFDIGQLFGKGWISDEKGAWSGGNKEDGLKNIYQNKTINRKDDSIDMRFREIPHLFNRNEEVTTDKTIKASLTKIEVDGKLVPRGLSGPMETFGGKGGSTYDDGAVPVPKTGPSIVHKGNAENIIPLDVNSVKNKTSNVSMQASYEDPEGETIFVKVADKSSFPFTEKGKESLTPSIVGGGGGIDEMAELLYKGG